jgi:hypothetical protein
VHADEYNNHTCQVINCVSRKQELLYFNIDNDFHLFLQTLFIILKFSPTSNLNCGLVGQIRLTYSTENDFISIILF